MIEIVETIIKSPYFQIILSAFFGGLFAGLFSNYFEVKRRLEDLRRTKYYDHRNTIVQIEHELLPSRINISRNISSLSDSLNNTNENNKRIVLRFFRLDISKGLSLNLLNLKIINLYAEVFSQFEIINNDIDYVNQIVTKIIDNNKSSTPDENLINLYFQFSEYLLKEINEADQKSLELLVYTKIILEEKEEKIIKDYLKNGKQVNYVFNKKSTRKNKSKIIKEETRKPRKKEVRPQFITPFLDIKRIYIN